MKDVQNPQNHRHACCTRFCPLQAYKKINRFFKDYDLSKLSQIIISIIKITQSLKIKPQNQIPLTTDKYFRNLLVVELEAFIITSIQRCKQVRFMQTYFVCQLATTCQNILVEYQSMHYQIRYARRENIEIPKGHDRQLLRKNGEQSWKRNPKEEIGKADNILNLNKVNDILKLFFKEMYFQNTSIIQINQIQNTIIVAKEMDIFQFIGDYLHLVSILMLLRKILNKKSVIGLSYRTQEMFFVVLLVRYTDLFLGWTNIYLFVMKILFLGLTAYIIFLMKFKKPYSLTLDEQSDNFPHISFYSIALLATIVVHKSSDLPDFMWSFSIWLESLSLLPQLYMTRKTQDIQKDIVVHYVLFLGLYRCFYLIHWIYEWEHMIWTSFIAGSIQTLICGQFLYNFFKHNHHGKFQIFAL